MFKRFTTRQLLITLGVLIGLYLISLMFGGRSERTFRQTIAALDSAKVTQILITPGGGQELVTLTKNGSQWQVKLPNDRFAPTADGMVERALGQINFLEAKQLVSRNEDQWSEYKVDTAGTRIQVMQGTEKALDLILGRFEYRTTGMTYTRLSGEDETYMVNGFLETSFNKKTDDWRDKTIVKGSSNEWSALTFTYPADTSYQILKGLDNNWILPDSTVLNTSEVNTYLGTLSSLNGTEFVDTTPSVSTPSFQLAIQSSSAGLIEIKAFADAEHGFLISSSLNPQAYFSGEAGGLTEKVFVGIAKFLQPADG
ncbi:MAG: DUF4340 domain-containing protein [Bacteroidota bacterium]